MANTTDNRNPRGFNAFMRQVDAQIAAYCGLESGDLPDYCYFDAYEDGAAPRDVAREVLEIEGYPF